jgi:hypothetical protein
LQFGAAVPDSPGTNSIGHGIMGQGLRVPAGSTPCPPPPPPPPRGSSTLQSALDATMSRLDHKLGSLMMAPQHAYGGSPTARRLELTTLPAGLVVCEPSQSQARAFEVRKPHTRWWTADLA